MSDTKSSKYSFQKFTSFNSRNSEQTLTITKNNTIGISSAFAEENGLSKYSFAVLYYDKTTKSIGVKFTNDKNETAKFALTRAQVGKGISIIAHSFFKKNNIDSNKYTKRKYLPKKLSLRRDLGIDESGSLFIIDLEKEVV